MIMPPRPVYNVKRSLSIESIPQLLVAMERQTVKARFEFFLGNNRIDLSRQFVWYSEIG